MRLSEPTHDADLASIKPRLVGSVAVLVFGVIYLFYALNRGRSTRTEPDPCLTAPSKTPPSCDESSKQPCWSRPISTFPACCAMSSTKPDLHDQARYGALGVLNGDRSALAEFITVGLDAGRGEADRCPPDGRGVLGSSSRSPNRLRLPSLMSIQRASASHPITLR